MKVKLNLELRNLESTENAYARAKSQVLSIDEYIKQEKFGKPQDAPKD